MTAKIKQELKQVVAIGASAGGLAAMRELLPHLPTERGVAFVLAQHMDPHHPSLLDQILQRGVALKVKAAENGEQIEPDCLYIIPPDRDGTVVDGTILLEAASHPQGPRHTVDILFSSVARAFGDRSIGIVLSGSGSDGLQGVRAIKAAEGVAIVQDPASAQYDGMPNAVIHERLADVIASADRIGEELTRVLEWPKTPAEPGPSEADVFQALIRALTRKTGIAFDQYKETTLRRRIERRRIVTRRENMADYLQLVEEGDEEAGLLLQDTLISVTDFFRDPDTFEAVHDAIKSILGGKKRGEAVRIWIPGCATGEEAFSIAILLAEELGHALRPTDVQIFATDIDEQAISTARKSVYLKSAVREMPEELLRKYFVATDGTYRIASTIRDMVTFAKHDLMQDPPFSRLDLVSCRNVLIYFKRPTQDRLMSTFHYVLNPGGYLVLGPSETIGKLTELFEPVDQHAKLFRRRDLDVRPPAVLRTKKVMPDTIRQLLEPRAAAGDIEQRTRDLVFDQYAPPSVVVDSRFNLVHSHGDITPFVRLPQGDISVNVLDMVAVPIRVELRLILQKAERELVTLRSNPIAYDVDGCKVNLTLIAMPLGATQGSARQTLLLFESRPVVERAEHGEPEENSGFRIRELEQELAATRDHLQTNIEELEASNEELQSVNEEYQSTTEELQSANEELQTTNEELQSTNEELDTVNEELRVRSEELTGANRDLESILNTAVSGIVVLDNDLRVTRYSSASREVFDLLPTSIGKPLIAVGGAVDLAILSRDIQRAVHGKSPVERELELGEKVYLVRLIPQPEEGESSGLVISFIEVTDSLVAAREARLLATVLRDSKDAITVMDRQGQILAWNRGAEHLFGFSEADALTMNIATIVPEADRGKWEDFVNRVYRGDSEAAELQRLNKEGRLIDVSVVASTLVDEAGNLYAIATTERDLTPIRAAELRRRQAEFVHESRLTMAGEMAAGLAHELNQPITSIMHFCDAAQSIASDPSAERSKKLGGILTDATDQARRAGDIIRTLRRFLERRDVDRRPQKLNDIIRDTAKLMRMDCEAHDIDLDLSLANDLPLVDVDSIQISQVLVNLIRNGMESISMSKSRKRKIEIVTTRDSNLVGSVQVTVRDTGAGISKKIEELLFEPFQTNKPNGLGMGLWICRSLVESHGGRLWADKKVREGAAFHFSLPAADAGGDAQ